MTRERLPDRRRCWTQKVRIAGQAFYLCCGEYPDGRPGEIFLEAHKEGTFSRGILTALARMTSIALQSGAAVDDVVKALRGLNFPPHGDVQGSAAVTQAVSVADWLSQEIDAAYLLKEKPDGNLPALPDEQAGRPAQEAAAPSPAGVPVP